MPLGSASFIPSIIHSFNKLLLCYVSKTGRSLDYKRGIAPLGKRGIRDAWGGDPRVAWRADGGLNQDPDATSSLASGTQICSTVRRHH